MSVLNVQQKNHICRAAVDRPEALNAVNFEVMDELEQLLTELEESDHIRCLIFRGTGSEAFVSGGDLREFHTITAAEEARGMARRMMQILNRIEKLPCWTLAAINGAAYGGGCEMALAFDFRIASAEALFGFTQGKFYLPPGWGGLTRLVECVGRSTALGWLAEAKIVDAPEALKHGLINHIAVKGGLDEEVTQWADKLTRNDRAFINNLKRGAMRASHARRKAMEAELGPFGTFWESERHRRRVEQFLERGEQ